MTEEELIVARAIREEECCGVQRHFADGSCDLLFCDDSRLITPQDCVCKDSARAALTALREAGYEARRATE